MSFGTTATITTITMSSTSVCVTTTSGVRAKDAGNASASGKTTNEFRVTPLKVTAR